VKGRGKPMIPYVCRMMKGSLENKIPCLPFHSSWMNVDEYFDVEEGAPSKNRK